eukprot:13203539-Heterocapsa_arctica.AAC.1
MGLVEADSTRQIDSVAALTRIVFLSLEMKQPGQELLEAIKPYVRKERHHVAENFVIWLKDT